MKENHFLLIACLLGTVAGISVARHFDTKPTAPKQKYFSLAGHSVRCKLYDEQNTLRDCNYYGGTIYHATNVVIVEE